MTQILDNNNKFVHSFVPHTLIYHIMTLLLIDRQQKDNKQNKKRLYPLSTNICSSIFHHQSKVDECLFNTDNFFLVCLLFVTLLFSLYLDIGQISGQTQARMYSIFILRISFVFD